VTIHPTVASRSSRTTISPPTLTLRVTGARSSIPPHSGDRDRGARRNRAVCGRHTWNHPGCGLEALREVVAGTAGAHHETVRARVWLKKKKEP